LKKLSPEIRLIRKESEYYEFSFRKLLKASDFITLVNGLLGLLSIVFAITGELAVACSLLLVATVADFLDGKVARLTKSSHAFGKELDSLADAVSFGVAPTIIGFSIIQTKFALLAFSVFLLCGILRLAKFNIMETKGVYIGMPITLNALVIPIAYFAALPANYFPFLYLALALFMIAPISWKKKF